MKRKVTKLSVIRIIFVGAFKHQLIQEDTLLVCTGIGLGQGFKYDGNLKRGLEAALVTAVVIGTVSGVINVIDNWDKLDKVVEGLEKED